MAYIDFLAEEIKNAYLIFKREMYYEHIDLFLRAKIASFDSVENKIEKEIKNISEFLASKNLEDPWFVKKLNSIDVNFLPKKIKNAPEIKENQGSNCKKINFISNLRTQEEYEIEEITYFMIGDISIYILSTLWSMLVGPYLDQELTKDCYANRLDLEDSELNIKSDFRLFKFYLSQYNNWRDGAINSGLDILKTGNNVLLVALDFKQCFYNLPVDWRKIYELINTKVDSSKKDYCIFLTRIIEVIHNDYYAKTKTYLEITHQWPNKKMPIKGIPIGLPSSRILANWELLKFDKLVESKLRPTFYGRYVDDILIILNNPDKSIIDSSTKILHNYFIDNKILELSTNQKSEENSKKQNGIYKVILATRQFDLSSVRTQDNRTITRINQ